MKKNKEIMIGGEILRVIETLPVVEPDQWEDIENELCAKSTKTLKG
jgi:hypothetical protein